MKKIFAMILLPMLLGGCYETGSAEKIGTIIKVGNGQGIIFKTVEAEIIRGGFNGGSGASGQSFHFTVESPELAQKLKVAMDNQQEVKIKYHTEFAAPFRSESDATFLDSFEIVEPKHATNNVTNDKSHISNNPKIIELLKVQAQLIEAIVAEQAK